MAPVLGYWDVRGLAQPIRLLLEYTGTEYEEKLYKCGEAPDYDKSCWFSVKETLGVDFPNLPYYFDGDTKVTQSNAILRYIARKHDLCGKTEEEKVRVDMLENQAMDLRNGFTRLCYRDFDTGKDAYLEAMPKTIKQYSDFLGTRPWFAGDNISFVDFVVYELLDEHLQLDKDLLKDAKNLQEFQKHFEELEPIKKYMASPRFLKSPINNRMAKFGNK
ncbi:glutathione S-transferase Mu 4-like isoform X2 [Eriocheir sinensis]|uniref:glutathione S-transferase Mu 4-like isoform X2 n=1 Tax=Eriocheir sinensis TaxID=95602 RepID=UPI0021C87C3C|nr:glutathione S-transferase Mu 4-like isoform X2 [Eriocheir sinensis]